MAHWSGHWSARTMGSGIPENAGVALGSGVAGVGVDDGVARIVGLGAGAGTGGAARFCGLGATCSNQSAPLSFVSVVLPKAPPGARSMLRPAAGATAGAPSTKALVASPQPTASVGAPPTARTTIDPPVAANPPL